MKTMTKQKSKATSHRTRSRDGNRNTQALDPRKAGMPAPAARTLLIESEEYEWTSSLNLPGLIVSPAAAQPVNARPSRPIWPHLDGIIETEDGDAASFCQLPGLLESAAKTQSPNESSPLIRDGAEWAVDEYAEIAAMQMPGLLVEPMAMGRESPEGVATRGLCATCVHQVDCSFPKPSSGVWRCEEYA